MRVSVSGFSTWRSSRLRGEVAPGQRFLPGRHRTPRTGASCPCAARPKGPAAKRLAQRSAASSERRSHPSGTDCWLGATLGGRYGLCTSRTVPMPIEACRDGGSLPATAKKRGSAATLPLVLTQPPARQRLVASCPLSGRTAIPCPATPKVSRTGLDRHRERPTASKLRLRASRVPTTGERGFHMRALVRADRAVHRIERGLYL